MGEAKGAFSIGFVPSDGSEHKIGKRNLTNVNKGFAGITLGQNSSTTVTYVRVAPSADIENGVWMVSQPFWGREVYFSAQ